MKCIAVDTTCLFHLLLSGYFTFLIYVVALLLAFHVCLTVYITDVGLHERFDDQANLKWHRE